MMQVAAEPGNVIIQFIISSRPEFEARVKTTRINPVTRSSEPYLPGYIKAGRVIFTTTFAIFLVSCFFNALLAT